MSSVFDPSTFLAGTAVDGAMDTEFVNVPEGEYLAVSGKPAAKQIDTVDGPRVVLEIPWEIDSADLEPITGRRKNTVKQGIFLDLTPGGGLDLGKGKNVSLGKVREELGQNNPGTRWTFDMLSGKTAYVTVSHRIGGEDGKIFAQVKSIRRL